MTESSLIVHNTEPKPIPLEDFGAPKILTREERAVEFRKELAAIQEQAETSETSSETNETQEPPTAILDSVTPVRAGDTDNDEDDLDNKPIPKKRLDREISKRHELELKLQEERDARIKYETELNLYNNAMQKLSTQKVQEPELDPIDNDAHNFYMSKIQALEKKIEEKTSNLEQTNQHNRFQAVISQQWSEFSKQHTDVDNAYQYVRDKEKQNARIFGIPENQLDSFVDEKLKPMAQHIYNQGGNVAETVYNLAKNYGYNAIGTNKPSNSNVNLRAIEKNMHKTQSMIDDVPASSVSIKNGGAANATKLSTFNDIMDKAGDNSATVFRRLLNDLANG